MKKLLFIALVLSGIIACSKDEDVNDDQQPPETHTIIGEWHLDRAHKIFYENGTKVDEEIESWQERMLFTKTHYAIIQDANDTTAYGPYNRTADSLLLFGSDTLRYGLIELSESKLTLALTEQYEYDSIRYRDQTRYFFER